MGLISMLFGCGKPQKAPQTQTVNPSELLYSLATLCDELPTVEQNTPVPSNSVVMHEDDWRQVEFVAPTNRKALEVTMTDFIVFRNAHRKGMGFTGVFVRKDTYPTVEVLSITTSKLTGSLFPLAIGDQSIQGGFSVKDDSGAYLYGQAKSDGTIVYLGLKPPMNGPLGQDFRKMIVSISSEYGLILADWYRGAIVENVTDDALRQWANLYRKAEHTNAPASSSAPDSKR